MNKYGNTTKFYQYENIQLSPVELSWIAGFFDGEGSVGFYNVKRTRGGKSYRSNRLYASIAQTDISPLKWIKQKFNMGSIGKQLNNKRNKYGWKCKPLYHYNVANNMARVFIKAILPYLKTQHKKNQAVKALKLDKKRIKGRWN